MMHKIPVTLVACSLTGCASPVVGLWDLSDYDEEAFANIFIEEEIPVREAKITDFSFAIEADEDDSEYLYGEATYNIELEMTYNDIDSEMQLSTNGFLSGRMEENGCLLEFRLDGEMMIRIPELEEEETEEIVIGTSLSCVLTSGELDCEDGEDISMRFQKL